MIAAPIELPIHLRHHSIKNTRSPDDKSGARKIKFVNPNSDNYERNIRHAASLNLPCYKKDMLKASPDEDGPVCVVVGSGPSLTSTPEVIEDIKTLKNAGALIFACKAAIKVLHDAGLQVDYGVSMDPGAHIAKPNKIFKAPGVTHIIASSSDPALFEYLQGENVIVFHSATGYKDEVKLYSTLFTNGDCMGGGYNVVNRAVSAALYMGASKIVLAGTDCGWRKNEQMYCDGPAHRDGIDMCDNGIVDGTPWMTRPDMLASGVALAKLAKKNPDKFIFLGDTLPAKLVHKDEAFLQKCANFQK